MRDAPPFVMAAGELARQARVTVDSIREAVGKAEGYASPAARTELLGAAEALRYQAAQLDILVGHIEGRLSVRHQAEARRKP